MWRVWGLAASWAAVWALPAGAQEPPRSAEATWRTASFSTAQGLPARRAERVLVGPDGTVWAGTTRGLARFDGFRWHPEVAPGGLAAAVWSLAPVWGSPDEILVATRDGLFRGGVSGFEEVFAPDVDLSREGGVAAPEPDAIYATRGRTVYRLVDGSLVDARQELEMEPGESVRQVWAVQPGVLWIATERGLFRHQDGRSVLRLPWSEGGMEVALVRERPDGTGLAYVARPLEDRGVWAWTRDTPPRRLRQDGLELVRDMALLPDLDVVVHAFGEVGVRAREGVFAAPPTQLHGTVALSVAGDAEDNVWMGTEQGVVLLRRDPDPWRRLRPLGPTRLSHRLQELARDSTGALWVATSDGLERHGADGSYRRFTEAAGTPLQDLTGLAADGDGNTWVSSGSAFDGVLRWNGRDWRRYGADAGFAGVRIHRIRTDGEGRLWFLGMAPIVFTGERMPEPGAFLWTGDGFRPFRDESGGPSSGRIYAMEEGDDGSLWFATVDGISRYRDGAWRLWTRADGLRMDRVFTLARGPDGRMWFSHQGADLGAVSVDGSVRYALLPASLQETEIWEVKRGPDGSGLGRRKRRDRRSRRFVLGRGGRGGGAPQHRGVAHPSRGWSGELRDRRRGGHP